MANSKPAVLSYEDPGFVNSPDGRISADLAEYVKPLAHFRRERIQDTVVFFGSARFSALAEASSALRAVGRSRICKTGCRRRAAGDVRAAGQRTSNSAATGTRRGCG